MAESTLQQLIAQHDLVLMEAAIVEQLRRGNTVTLDPLLVHGQLIYDETGRAELGRLYEQYAVVAANAEVPLLLCTPTWRTNFDRVQDAGVNKSINRDAVKWLSQLRDNLPAKQNILIGGLIGCKNDCYRPDEALSINESESFHRWQIEDLVRGGVDYLLAATLPSISEAHGIAKAMCTTDKPYFISFVINRHGMLLDGTPLIEAVRTLDSDVRRKPFAYLVNCAYPTFICADQQPPELFRRLIGIQANASSLDHSELDRSSTLQANELGEWGDAMLRLHRRHGLKILGGCCGTSQEYLKYLVDYETNKTTGMDG